MGSHLTCNRHLGTRLRIENGLERLRPKNQTWLSLWSLMKKLSIRSTALEKACLQCDQIGRFIGIWATFQSLCQQWVCPNLPYSWAIFLKLSKSLIFLVKSLLDSFYGHLATFFWSRCLLSWVVASYTGGPQFDSGKKHFREKKHVGNWISVLSNYFECCNGSNEAVAVRGGCHSSVDFMCLPFLQSRVWIPPNHQSYFVLQIVLRKRRK